MIANDARYTITQTEVLDGCLCVTWGDDHKSRFHAIWLRHQCMCKNCGTPMNAVRGIRLHHIPEDIAIETLKVSQNTVTLIWSGDNHRSQYEGRWLRENCYSASERALRKHRPNLWDRNIETDPPVASFQCAEFNPTDRLAVLEAVRDYGFCKITDAPTQASESHRLIEIVGPQRQTHFGTYSLSNKTSVTNVGDITDALDPHIDETYRLSTIGITVFQVLCPSANGGASTLVDGFEAARQLRDQWPEDFDLLTRLPITAHRIDEGHNSGGRRRWYTCRIPVIKLDSDGDLAGIRINERQIAPLDIEASLVEPMYQALRRLLKLLYSPELRITFPLQAGEGLLFDNQRVLHGRTAFTTEEPARSVLTSSVDLEEFHSSLRLLQRDLGIHSSPMLLCQGMAV